MRVTTLDTVAGRSIDDTLGVVRGTILWTRGLKKFSRGGIRAVEYMTMDDVAEGLNKAREDAEAQMKRQALALGADTVVGLRIEIMEMGGGMFQAAALGTAVRTSSLAMPPAMGAPTFGKRDFMASMTGAANDSATILPFRQNKVAGGHAYH